MGSETSVQNYYSTLRNIPAERRSHLHRGRNLKSRIIELDFSEKEFIYSTPFHYEPDPIYTALSMLFLGIKLQTS